MAAKKFKPCEWCGKLHEVRVADLNRGWGRFCSKRCKAMKQEKRTGQNAAYQERREHDDDSHVGGFMTSGWFGHGQE